MSQPLISICITTYNRTDLLIRLLDSIKTQTFLDYEIIMNDNSTNNEVELLVKSYQSKIAINYEKNCPTVTAAENCNKVMHRSNGKWIKLMHDDDWFSSSNALNKFALIAKQTEKNFIFSGSYQVQLNTGKSTLKLFTNKEKKIPAS